MFLRRLFYPTVVAALAAAAACPLAAQDGATRGAQALQWIESFDCPVPGQPISVPGLKEASQLEVVRRENRAFIESRREALDVALRARAQIEREIAGKAKPGKRLEQAFAELDAGINDLGGQVTYALAQMAMAGYVELSQTSLDQVPSATAPHPLKPFLNYGADLRRLAAPYGPAAEAVPERWDYCLNATNNAFVIEFEAEILSDVDAAADAASITQVYSRWSLPGLQNDSPVLQQVRSIQLARADEERREVERRRAERDAEARQVLQAQAQRELRIAQQYVDHVKAGRTQSAIDLLTSDVFLSSPNGNVRGRDAVAQRMREAADNSAGASMGSPVVGSGYSIWVDVRSSRGSGRMTFGFRDGRISSITLRQN